ncbi:plasma-membrane proton-efflux P-type ATPase [Mucilaginibacter lappiensis]|uniref:H+-transporting ATPase n=1 Tax=Mucilaginibacter lappiensis TaxID=354630 RepID=A0A841JJJ7_9SPHI|nr:plasma-membrane proton-efflux P-type ATPase [Mucilaginibacter lappiensis]MBB6131117.1 H+-transporting ATPase [Mucilaginibacter lappiensis]
MAELKTNPAKGLSQAEVPALLKQFGYNEITENKTHPLLNFLSKFWGLTAWMLEFIVVLSIFLHNTSDAYVVGGLLILNALISFTLEQSAANAVAELRKKLQVNVKLLRDSIWKTALARELVPGDIIRVRIGDFVPADFTITDGQLSVDQSALTGESGEVDMPTGKTVYSGSIVTKGEATGVVTLTGLNTYFGKTASLVKSAAPKSHIDEVLAKVVQWLLFIVAALLILAFVVSIIRGMNPLQLLPLMLVLLLGAIPVALTAMFTISMALGSKELSGQGVLVTRLNAPNDAASMDVLCVDKTGTLTINKLTVAKLIPAVGFTEGQVLLYGALASQEADHDAIDMAMIGSARDKKIINNSFVQKSFVPFDPKTRKTEASITNGNELFSVIKGAAETLYPLCKLDITAITNWNKQIDDLAKSGYRAIAVAQTKDNNTEFVGVVALHDPPRTDSMQIIKDLAALGVTVKMLTGDALPIAEEMSKTLQIGDKILNASVFKECLGDPKKAIELLEQNSGFAGVYPEDKYNIVKTFQASGHIVGMTGDGVNDSPALKQAEVGIAVSNATDVAKGAASIVLTKEGLSSIPAPIITGRKMFERINIWILNKITRSIFKTCFVVIAYLVFGKYVISASAILIIIFMTDFVKVSLATDNVIISQKPARWNINSLAKVGLILGLLMTIEAFPLLYYGLHHLNLNNNNAALSTYSFVIILYFGLFSLFVVREKRHFWNSWPSKTLLYLIIGDMILGVILVTFGWLSFTAIPLTETLIVIAYTGFISFTINDLLKFILLRKWQMDMP